MLFFVIACICYYKHAKLDLVFLIITGEDSSGKSKYFSKERTSPSTMDFYRFKSWTDGTVNFP